MRTHVDRSMGSELRGIHDDAAADGMHLLGQAMDRWHDPGDVGRTRHREQCDPACVAREEMVEVSFVERAVGPRLHMHGVSPGAPGQVVRVVFEHGREHDGVGAQGDRAGERVERFGRVLAEHDDIAGAIGADEFGDAGTGVLEQLGAEARPVAVSAVHARRERQELLHRIADGTERRCARGVVEVDV